MLDANRPAPSWPAAVLSRITDSNTVVAWNKADLRDADAPALPSPPAGLPALPVSALTGAGLAELRAELERRADRLQETFGDERIAINVRHAHYLGEARACLEAAQAKVESGGPAELLASDLRGALAALGEISGKVDNERMLDQLFASFCIGK